MRDGAAAFDVDPTKSFGREASRKIGGRFAEPCREITRGSDHRAGVRRRDLSDSRDGVGQNIQKNL